MPRGAGSSKGASQAAESQAAIRRKLREAPREQGFSPAALLGDGSALLEKVCTLAAAPPATSTGHGVPVAISLASAAGQGAVPRTALRANAHFAPQANRIQGFLKGQKHRTGAGNVKTEWLLTTQQLQDEA